MDMLSQRKYFILNKIKNQNLKFGDIDKIVYDGKRFTPEDITDYRERGLIKKAKDFSDFSLDLTEHVVLLNI